MMNIYGKYDSSLLTKMARLGEMRGAKMLDFPTPIARRGEGR
jgi:hypothetical protein